MRGFNLSEQEQIDQIKYFWSDWGKYLIAIIVVALAVYITDFLWNKHKDNLSNQAASVYFNFTTSVSSGNNAIAYKLAQQLEEEYPHLQYSDLASIWAAKLAYTEKNIDLAKNFLLWTINDASDKNFVSLAKLRLAKVYIDQKQFDKAMSLLKSDDNQAFSVLFYQTRGDLYIAKNEPNMARDAYKEALKRAGDDSSITQSIQLKLDVLGS